MPLQSKRIVLRDSYCSAPPLTTSSHVLLRPRLSRAEEAGRPRAPLRPVKAEVCESEDSVEFVVDEEDFERPVEFEPRPVKVEHEVKIEPDTRQLTARVAAITIRQPASAASASSDEKPGPSGTAYRTQALSRIRSGQLGPADSPRGHSRLKGSRSRPRILPVFGLPVPPERAAATKAQAEMASSSSKQ